MNPASPRSLSLLIEAGDPASAAAPVRWAVEQLRAALAEHGIAAPIHGRLSDSEGSAVVLIAGRNSPAAAQSLAAAGLTLPNVPEGLAIIPTTHNRPPATGQGAASGPSLVVTGSDARGLVYALLELADRVACAVDAAEAVRQILEQPPVVEQPANTIRGIMRVFSSDVEDLGWYHDREFWTPYLTELVSQRFNRFQLALGIGYDFARRMRDSYFYFSYPFLLAVPGYDVRAVGVSDAERDRNLETLRFIARETRRRGLHFQLGLWAQVYEYAESPDVNHTIEGLTPETHAAYCRDAIRALLEAVPEIDGLTLRVHGESGIPEGSYDFWRTLFAGIAGCGRRVEIDMHAKGIDQRMIDLALETGQPVVVSPKFWAEHMGLPYHQADIRAVEHPAPATGQHADLMALSAGTRRFTRYGYADLLTEDRRCGILFRVWPGTHRLLLWGDPVTGRAYGRAFGFCGSLGTELFEPLSFSGRRGSGLPEGRDPYDEESLRPEGAHAEWEKYRYTYRLWGRLLYDPEADPESWRRYLRREFGAGADAAEAALASASRILPLVTTAHLPSAANNRFWPEIYTDMPIVDESRPQPYGDTANPKRFGNVSALDPELFSSADEYVEELLSGNRGGRYSPLDVARWLDGLAGEAEHRMLEAERQVQASSDWHEAGPGARASSASAANLNVPSAFSLRPAAFQRLALDVRIEAAVGRFFAGKLRAAVGYTLFRRTGDVPSLRDAVTFYREARAAWSLAAAEARGTYKSDLTFGPEPPLRGHWADRRADIDQDVRDMEAALQQAEAGAAAPSGAVSLQTALAEQRPEVSLQHNAPAVFTPGAPLSIEVIAPAEVAGVQLRYRHVNQAERFQTVEMRREEDAGGGRFSAAIPGEYTRSAYPLQYLLTLRAADGTAWRWPGLGAELADTPYLVVRSAAG